MHMMLYFPFLFCLGGWVIWEAFTTRTRTTRTTTPAATATGPAPLNATKVEDFREDLGLANLAQSSLGTAKSAGFEGTQNAHGVCFGILLRGGYGGVCLFCLGALWVSFFL